MLDASGAARVSFCVGRHSNVQCSLRHFIIVCLGALLTVGCAHTISLKFVDSKTHEPLAGVSTRWLQARVQMFQTLKQEGPTNLPPSGDNGTITIKGLRHWWESEFIFTCTGYSNVYGFYDTSMRLAPRIQPLPMIGVPDYFLLPGDVTMASKSNGVFLIEMPK